MIFIFNMGIFLMTFFLLFVGLTNYIMPHALILHYVATIVGTLLMGFFMAIGATYFFNF